MHNPEFETSAWPLLQVRIHGPDDDASISRLLSGLAVHIARGKCGIVVDTTEIVYPSLVDAQRWMRMEADWTHSHRALIARHVQAVGFVITNPAIRFLLSGILLLGAIPCPHAVTSSRHEARAFCSERLHHRSASIPARAPRAGGQR